MEFKSREATRTTKREASGPSEPLDTNRTKKISKSNVIASNTATASDAVTSVEQTTAPPPLPIHKKFGADATATNRLGEELPAHRQQSSELSELPSHEALKIPCNKLDKKGEECKKVKRRTARETKKKQARRGKPKRHQTFEKLKIIGTNANGINSKKESLNSILSTEKPQVFMLQETKCGKPNQISIEGYELYESPRKGKGGGGILIGMRKDLENTPVIVSKHDDGIEIMVMEVAFGSMVIRFLTAYGPQEGDSEDIINKFYTTLEEEILNCEEDNCGLIAELDCNAKLGGNIIKGDPNEMSENGRIFWDVLERRNCMVVNASPNCSGCLTRSRMKAGKKEESVLDYVFVNALISPFINAMVIDESKQNALTRFNNGRAIQSDHHLISCTFDIPVRKKVFERKEVYRLRNPEELQLFKEATTNTDKFSKCFKKDGDIKVQGQKWMKLLQNSIKKSFTKIRIRKNNKKDEMQEKMKERKDILKKIHNSKSATERFHLEDKVKDIEREISEEQRQKQIQRIQDQISAISDADGRVNTSGVWKLRKKLCPKPLEQLTAKMDKEGNLVTDPESIKEIYLEAYADRLKHKNILPELENHKILREQLFSERLALAKSNKSPPWTMDQLDNVLRKLKRGKATDPAGLVNELFMYEYIGDDLKKSLLILLNKIKDHYVEPDFMSLANITSFWKGKGSRHDIEYERGIFILLVIRMIKDKMIYNDTKGNIKISDSQVGGRTEYSIRNHLFVIYSVLNSVIQKESPPVDIHMYDLCKCFDSLWLEECCNNLYEAGITDDKLALIYEGNRVNNVAVRTPGGLTDRILIERIVTQGGVTGPLCCSVQTDAIGKSSLETGEHLYMYKSTVGIPTLAMVDDLAKISECGVETTKDSAYINAKVEQDKLLFNGPKCNHLHAGKPSNLCPIIRAHTTEIQLALEEKYVGDIISSDGKHSKNIASRRLKGIGICNEITAILNTLFLGPFHFQIALLLREVMLLSVLLFNSETWLRLTKENVKKLESVDEMLLRKILVTPISTPTVALYLETGSIPIRFILKKKRIMFLHHILTREKEALIHRVLMAQINQPAKGDWCVVVREDLDSFGLSNISFDEISKMSKDKLKMLLNDVMARCSFEELDSRKLNLSKVSGISYNRLEIQPYLTDPQLSIKLKQLTFKWRTKMVKVGWNFGQKEACPLCCNGDDTQDHLFYCESIFANCDVDWTDKNNNDNNNYDLEQHIKRLETAIRKREIILEERAKQESKTAVEDTL